MWGKWKPVALRLCIAIAGMMSTPVLGQVVGAPPPGAACVVSAGNRNAPLAPDGSYTVFGIPGNLGAIRARVTCSDGSIGQSSIGFTNPFAPATIDLGPITFGQIDPVPVAASLSAPSRRLNAGQTSQLTMTAIGLDGSVRDVTPRSQGTVYTVSNELLASVSEDGLVQIHAAFASGSTARVVTSATTEGSVSATYMYTLGPRGKLTGTVFRSDGTTPVIGAEVSVVRLQPTEFAGSAYANAQGEFELTDVNAGPFLITALDRATGDRALAFARLETENQTVPVTLRMNGQSTVNVSVIDAQGTPVSNAPVTFTALGAYRDTRTAATDSSGVVTFSAVSAGDFTVSARDPVSRLVGTGVDNVAPDATKVVTLRLQPIGAIEGRVLDVDGTTPKAGVQIRILSRERGILTQSVTDASAQFHFDTLPIGDGPFTLDAFVDGRLRAREPGIVLSQPNETITRDVVLRSVGTVRGRVTSNEGTVFAGARVTMQSLEGLRLSFDAKTDESGRFVLPAVPVGNFELSAITMTGRSGRASGRLNADGDLVDLDVVIASNTLVGTVYQRDGVTPVGAGVDVYLAPRSANPPYTYEGVSGVERTETDAQGRFGFVVETAQPYSVQAEHELDRGRTEAVLVNLDPSQPLVANITFLAKGTISGTVRDPNGQVQSDIPVSLHTRGAFGATRTTRTNAGGHYSFDGAFIGDITVVASNEATRLTGVAEGRLDVEGQLLNLDVVLAATGSLSGAVLERNGGAVTSPVLISVRRNHALFTTVEIPNGANYLIENVPLGDIEVFAEKLSTGDRGSATTRLSTVNELKSINVRLVGQGTLRVHLVDESATPVANASVIIRSLGAAPMSLSLQTNAAGYVESDRVSAGDFTLTADKSLGVGRLSGSAAGTLVADEIRDITVQMTGRAIGAVQGVVMQPDGITPVGSGWIVSMLPEPSANAFVTATAADGSYRFDNVGSGSYTIDVLKWIAPPQNCPSRDRIRGRGNVTVAVQGETVEEDIQLIGQGSLFGRTLDAQGMPIAGIELTLTNPDPIYGRNVTCLQGTTYRSTSDSLGNYRFADLPPGDFTIVAANATSTLMAEGRGRVRFDGDEVELDLTLVNSAVSMPRTFYDANGFKFEVSGNGALLTGTNNVFSGIAPDANAERLEIIVDGVPVPFVNGNGTVGSLISDGQQIEVDDGVSAGLHVTRRILVPRAGYFTRYLEILRNPTDAPITVGVRIKSHHSASSSNPRVVDSSDGDQILAVNGNDGQDRWVVVDDSADSNPFKSSSIPATAHLFDGPSAPVRVAAADYALIGQTGKLTYQWNSISVPPDGTVILMHFALHQLSRFHAREAALRLSELPPEAIQDLTTDEREQILNFVVPETSTVEALPNLDAGIVDGHVYSGDGTTPIAGAIVRFKSKHLLFGRERFVTSGADGSFEYRSTLDGTSANYVIPVYAFDLDAEYGRSNAETATASGDFDVEATRETQDVIFAGMGDLRGIVRRHNGSPVAGAYVTLCHSNNRSSCSLPMPSPSNWAYSGEDGRFTLFANAPRNYYLFSRKDHPQQYSSDWRPMYGEGSATVTAGDVATTEVWVEETGSVTGIVKSSDGTPVVNARVYLSVEGVGSARTMRSDTAGRYRFVDVPVGLRSVKATDVISGAEGAVSNIVVRVDEETTQDITLAGFGTLNVHVEFARGVPAGGGWVEVFDESGEHADSNGLATFELAAGDYSIRAFLPEAPNRAHAYSTAVPVSISSNGQVTELTITLPPAGAVQGTIVRPDGTTLAGGFPYTITPLSGQFVAHGSLATNASGIYRAPALPIGTYLITAYDAQQDRFADAEFTVTQDGEEVVVNLTLLPNRIALPATLYDANRFAFDVQQSGALATGSNAYGGAAAKLLVNGQAYVGETSARLDADRRQFVIAQPTAMGGLLVTRKIFVPRGAYFARHLEVLENPTTNPVTVMVALEHRFASGAILSSSDGNGSADASDSWVTFDDAIDEDIKLGGGMPAAGHVFAAPASQLPPNVVSVTSPDGTPVLIEQWSNLTVPAGGRVALMHFSVQQVNRRGVAAAVERLSLLPPEVLAWLSAEERVAVRNFDVPVDGQSAMAQLPNLTSTISGIALEGDERTPVRNARITVQSEHPLFNRVWGMSPESNCPPGTSVASLRSTASLPPNVPNPTPIGSYELIGQLTASGSIALPEGVPITLTAQVARDCFSLAAGHPVTHLPSRVVQVTPPTVANVVWDSAVVTGTAVGTQEFAVRGGRVFRSIENPDFPDYEYVPIAEDGTYVYPGLPAGTADLLFDTRHPQATGPIDLRGQRLSETLIAGQVTVTDFQLQPSGMLQGAVINATGSASVNALATLIGDKSEQTYDQCAPSCVPTALPKHFGKFDVLRTTRTDSLGRYSFSAVPSGVYTLIVTDPASDARTFATVTISQDQVTVKNITLLALGTVELTVESAVGLPVADAYVYLKTDALEFEKVVGRTNASGHLTVANINVGAYTIRVTDPRHASIPHFDRTTGGTIAGQGAVEAKTVRLLAASTLAVTVTNSGAGNAAVSNATIRIDDARGTRYLANTDAQGKRSISGVPEGTYRVYAGATIGGQWREVNVGGTIAVANDNQTVAVPIDMQGNRVDIPIELNGVNRDGYTLGLPETGNDLALLEVAGVGFNGGDLADEMLGGREIAMTQQALMSGLRVSRRQFVHPLGYFVRHLEILENPSATDIVTAVVVRVQDNSRYNAFTVVRSTSSGDAVITNSGTTRDFWFAAGESSGSGDVVTNAVVAGDGLGRALPNLATHGNYASLTWDSLTIPANGRVVLLHFRSLQPTSSGAIAASQRLAQLPPEALEGISSLELADLANYSPPPSGSSALSALPSLDAQISGRVFEADGTPVVGAKVAVRSQLGIFNRQWDPGSLHSDDPTQMLLTDQDGRYAMHGAPSDDTYRSIVLPAQQGIEVRIGHPSQSGYSAITVATPTPGSSSVAHDVTLPSGIIKGRITGAFGMPVMTGTIRPTKSGYPSTTTPINADGTYSIGGMPAGTGYTLTVAIKDSYSDLLTATSTNVSVTVGQTTIRDIALPANGGLRGRVTSPMGVSNRYVNLDATSGVRYSRYTDAEGGFSFGGLRTGTYTLSLSDESFNTVDSRSVTIVANQFTTQDLVDPGKSTLQLRVTNANGSPASQAGVYWRTPTITSETFAGTVSPTTGELSFELPATAYTVRVRHTRTGEDVTLTGAFATNGETQVRDVVLPPWATVAVTVVDADNANAPVEGAHLIKMESGSTTEFRTYLASGTSGEIAPVHVRSGNTHLSVITGNGIETTQSVAVDAATDTQLLPRTISLKSSYGRTGTLTFAGERKIYGVDAEANDRLALSVSPQTNCTLTGELKSQDGITLLASAYRSGLPSSIPIQVNSAQNARSITVPRTERYRFFVSSNCASSPFRVSVSRNGIPAPVLDPEPGGSVSGTAFRSDGTTPYVNLIVELRESGALGSKYRVTTGANGTYNFPAVAVGDFTVVALPPTGSTPLASVAGTIASVGQAVIANLVLPTETTLAISVLGAGDVAPSPAPYVNFYHPGEADYFSWLRTNSAGQVTYVHRGNEPIRVEGELYSTYWVRDSVVVDPADGQVVPVTVRPIPATLSGILRDADGTAMASVQMQSFSDIQTNALESRTTNAQGAFAFTVLPSGPVRVKVTDTRNGIITVKPLILTLGQQVAEDFVLTGRATLDVRVVRPSGTPLSNARVKVSYENDGAIRTTTEGITNAQGRHAISNLPVGRTLTVAVTYAGVSPESTSAETALPTHGATVSYDVTLDSSGGALRVTIDAADGIPVPGDCSVALAHETDGNSQLDAECSSTFEFEDLSPGAASVTASNYDFTSAAVPATVVIGQSTDVSIPLSVIKGSVRNADDTPSPWAWLWGEDSAANYIGGQGDENGNYRVFGATPGPFDLTAEEDGSALTTTRTGELPDPAVPMTLDFVLQAFGSVSGTVRDESNSTVPNAEVYLRSAGLPWVWERQTHSDAQGLYRFEHVALGHNSIGAINPGTQNIASGETLLSTQGESQTVDLNFAPSGSVSGIARIAEGVAAANYCVELRSTAEGAAYTRMVASTQTDASGAFAFASVVTGQVSLTLKTVCGAYYAPAGYATGAVSAGVNSVIDVMFGNALTLSRQLNDAVSGFGFNVYGRGGPSIYGVFYDTPVLTVNGRGYPWQSVAVSTQNGRELEIPAITLGGLRVSRRYFVPESGGYVRVLESFTNTSASPIGVPFRITGSHADRTPLLASSSPSSGRWQLQSSSGTHPAIAYVLSGTAEAAPSFENFGAGQRAFGWGWDLSVAPGQTVNYLYYMVPRSGAAAASAAQAQAIEIVNGTLSGMFEGLSAEDKARIQNFQVP